MAALWSGRFNEPPDGAMRRFSDCLEVDLQMFEEDIRGSQAHATMLEECGLLSSAEADTLRDGLRRVAEELRDGRFKPSADLEDIHMAVEWRLTELVGEVGGKLHTARSRNDQVATDVRLWLKSRLPIADQALVRLLRALLKRVASDGRTLVPGFTHLQWGQPIWLGHHLLAHAWALARDRERLEGVARRVDRSPLGAGAMAGTPHPIDRSRTAQLLDFGGLVENAMDAVAGRDTVIEVAAVCAIGMTTLSRMAEELVMWSGPEFNLVRLHDAYTTGSSIMPQKRNPDAAELVRGKTGRVVGDLQTLLMLVKGLPLAYNRDLQEDRRPLFDAVATWLDSTAITAGMWETLEVNAERYRASLQGSFVLATELADYLVTRGVPFRQAHHAVGRLVRWCEEQGRTFKGLDGPTLREHHPAFGDDALDWLDAEKAVERRGSTGGTAWQEIERQMQQLSALLPTA